MQPLAAEIFGKPVAMMLMNARADFSDFKGDFRCYC
jgi:hypothetical protein